jgi:hypothetical protein
VRATPGDRPGASPGRGAEPTAQDAAPCPEAGLRVQAEEPDAAMGLRAMTVYVTNCGKTSQTVSGYPAAHVLDEDHNRVKVTIHQGMSVTTAVDDPAPDRITLKPGERALTVLAWRNTVTDSTVVATTGAYLEVTLVAGGKPEVTPVMIDLGNTGKLDVTAWRRPPA